MADVLGFATAVVVLIAALFGLIPPLLSNSGGEGAMSDKAAASFIESITPIVVIAGLLGLFFFYLFGMTSLANGVSGGNIQGEETIDLRGLNEDDYNIIANAELLSNYRERDAAFQEIVNFALFQENYALATLAASNLSNYRARNEQALRIHRAAIAVEAARDEDVQSVQSP